MADTVTCPTFQSEALLITKLKIPIKLPVLLGALSIAVVVANLLQIIDAGSNQQAVLWAVFFGSVVASLGYFVHGDIKSHKRILALILALTCAVGDGLSNANPVFVIGFVMSIAVLVGFSSSTLKTYFTTTPSVVAITLFVPLALMHSSLMSLVSITALTFGEVSTSYSHEADARNVARQWQAQIGAGAIDQVVDTFDLEALIAKRVNTIFANVWEETVRVGMYPFCVNMDETPTPLEISVEGGDT
jgi:hypothetical protein